MTSTITAEDRRSIAWIDELRQKNINADAEIKSLKLQLDEEKLAAEHRQAIFGGWGEELTQFRQKNINADAEIKSLKLSLADRDEEVKTLKDDADRWEANCLYAEEWEDKYANGVLGRKKKNEIYADSGGDDDYRQAILDEIKSLKLQLDEEKLAYEKQDTILFQKYRKKAHEIKTLKLSLADRDEEVKTLKDEVDKQTILANGYRDTSDDYYEEKKELKDEMKSLKLQLADNDHTTFETHEHHRELRDKLNAEIKSLKLHHSSYYYRHHLDRL